MILIKDGRLVDPLNKIDEVRDLVIEDDKIKYIGKFHRSDDYSRVIEAEGCVVAPGLVGTNVHLESIDMPELSTIKNDVESAFAGGYTTLVYQSSIPYNNHQELKALEEQLKDSGINIYISAAFPKMDSSLELSDDSVDISNVVVGLSNDLGLISDETYLYKVLKQCSKSKIPVSLFSENPSLIQPNLFEKVEGEGNELHKNAANLSQDVFVSRDCMMALYTQAKVLISNISTRASAEMVRLSQRMGAKVYAEVAPHHFSLTDESIEVEGSLAKTSPPLRSKEDRYAMLEGLRDGTISIISAYNRPVRSEDKAHPYKEAKNGIVSLETALSLGITYLVKKGHLTMWKLIEKMAMNPARSYNIDAGYLSEGSRADIVIFDENQIRTVEPFKTVSQNSPFLGKQVFGKVKYTISSGKVVYENP